MVLMCSVSVESNGLVSGCLPLGGSRLGFVIQDHTDHGASKEWRFSSLDQLP